MKTITSSNYFVKVLVDANFGFNATAFYCALPSSHSLISKKPVFILITLSQFNFLWSTMHQVESSITKASSLQTCFSYIVRPFFLNVFLKNHFCSFIPTSAFPLNFYYKSAVAVETQENVSQLISSERKCIQC